MEIKSEYSPFRSLLKGAGFVLAGNFLIYFIGFIYHIPVVRILGPEKYGLWRLVYTIITIVAPLSLLGLGPGVLFYLSKISSTQRDENIRGILISSGKILIVSTFVATVGLLIFTAGWVEKIYPYPGLKVLLYVTAFAVPFIAFQRFGESVLRAVENAKAIYQVKVYQELFKLLLIPLILWRTEGRLVFLAILTLVGYILSAFYLGYFIDKIVSPFKQLLVGKYKSFSKKLISYSWPLLITDYVQVLGKQIDIIFIGFFLTTVAVGVYTPAVILSNLLWVVPMAMSYLLFPIMNRLFAKENREEFFSVSKRAYKYMIYLTIPCLCFIVLFSQNILRLLYGKEFEAGYFALIFLSLSICLPIFSLISWHILGIYKKTKIILAINILGMTFNVAANYILIPIYGINGAAVATFLSVVLMSILSVISATILIKKFIFPWKSIGIVILGAIVILISFIVKERSLFFNFTTFTLFILTVILTGFLFEKNELKSGWNLIKARLLP